MTNEIIVDMFWDRRIVQNDMGVQHEQIREKDYDFDWKKLGYGYAKREKTLYFYGEECDYTFKRYYKAIDFDSFEILEVHEEKSRYNPDEIDVKTIYFKDKNNIYVTGVHEFSMLEDVNVNSFKIIDLEKGFTTDGNHDFVFAQKLPYRFDDREEINTHYAKVNDSVYFGFLHKLNCDTDSFEIVHPEVSNVAKDKTHVFYKDQVIEGANPKTFHFLEACVNLNRAYAYDGDIDFYAKDDKQAYFISTPFMAKALKTKSLDHFRYEIIDKKGYAFDKSYKYYRGKRKKI